MDDWTNNLLKLWEITEHIIKTFKGEYRLYAQIIRLVGTYLRHNKGLNIMASITCYISHAPCCNFSFTFISDYFYFHIEEEIDKTTILALTESMLIEIVPKLNFRAKLYSKIVELR